MVVNEEEAAVAGHSCKITHWNFIDLEVNSEEEPGSLRLNFDSPASGYINRITGPCLGAGQDVGCLEGGWGLTWLPEEQIVLCSGVGGAQVDNQLFIGTGDVEEEGRLEVGGIDSLLVGETDGGGYG